MSTTAVLVMAKVPVPGLVKTRLGQRVGMERAAELAHAALLDTLEACEAASGRRYLALAGDPGAELVDRLRGWTVFPQRGNGFGERLHHAHLDVTTHAQAPVVQIGMDTPHVTAEDLVAVSAGLGEHHAVLGPAEDGGWWALALRDPRYSSGLAHVEMSTPRTCADTRESLRAAGASVGTAHVLRDVDTVADADAVARSAPHLRFSRAWAVPAVTR